MFYIYRHIRPDTNEVFYVGKGLENSNRHLSKQGRNKYWHNIVNKNNGQYDIEIMMEDLTHEESIEKEQEFIKLYGRRCDGGTLCNLSLGGEGGTYGYTHTEETKELMSEFASGKPKSEETKKRISLSKKGISINKVIPILNETQEKAWEANRKKVKCLITGKIYDSVKSAAIDKNINYSTLKSRFEKGAKINTLSYI